MSRSQSSFVVPATLAPDDEPVLKPPSIVPRGRAGTWQRRPFFGPCEKCQDPEASPEAQKRLQAAIHILVDMALDQLIEEKGLADVIQRRLK